MQYAELKPELSASFFTDPRKHQTVGKPLGDGRAKAFPSVNQIQDAIKADEAFDDDFDDDFDDQDWLEMGNIITTLYFVATVLTDLAVDAHGLPHTDTFNKKADAQYKGFKPATDPRDLAHVDHNEPEWNPRRLDSGKWACNHKCKDKNA